LIKLNEPNAMKMSFCLIKQTASSDQLRFESDRLHWTVFDKGTPRKSGTLQPFNSLSAQLVGEEESPPKDQLASLLTAFDQVGGIAAYLARAQPANCWLRIEAFASVEQQMDWDLDPSDLRVLANLNLGLEFWFER
jgi:hypothetical protein